MQAQRALEERRWAPLPSAEDAGRFAEELLKRERRRQRAAKGAEGASAHVSPASCPPSERKRPSAERDDAAEGSVESPAKVLRLDEGAAGEAAGVEMSGGAGA